MVWAIATVKDELDVIEETVGRMVAQVDRVLVADNGSTDGTRELLDELDVVVIDDPETGYYQSHRMSRLAEEARRGGADWIVPFDADEVWLARTGPLGQALDRVDDDIAIAEADLYDHVPTSRDHPGPPIDNVWWRRANPAPLPKVACRAVQGLVIHQGNHGATFPGDEPTLRLGGLLTIRHFPYRTAEQMIRKARNGAAAYAATDLPEEVGKHWRDYGRLSDEQIGEVFREHFWSDDPAGDGLVLDPCP